MSLKKLLLGLACSTISFTAAVPLGNTNDFNLMATAIVDGVPASLGDIPFMVSLSMPDTYGHFCGGTLLNSNTVITAAHCLYGLNSTRLEAVRVRAGSLSSNGTAGIVSSVTSVHIHPNFNQDVPLDCDVGIVKLSAPIDTCATIKYATLPAPGYDPVPGLMATTAGWGATVFAGDLVTELRKVDLPVVSRGICRTQYLRGQITDNMLCAGYDDGTKGTCGGDSGGPLFDSTTKVLIGHVLGSHGCAEPGYVGVFTRVGNFLEFINSHL